MNFEEFCVELEAMKRWLSKGDRKPEWWWLAVEDYAKAEGARHYKQSHAKEKGAS